MKSLQERTENGMVIEWNANDGEYYYIHPAGLVNRVSTLNPNNFREPTRTYIFDAIARIEARKVVER